MSFKVGPDIFLPEILSLCLLTEIVKNIDKMKRLILLFSVSVLLTVQHLEAQTAVTDTVFLQLYNDSVDLKEVVVKGKKTPVANSRWSDMSPVELVTVGGANGDLYQALQTLPGTQVQGESGRLLVRGHRVTAPENLKRIRVSADATRIEPILIAPLLAVPLLLLLLIGLLVSGRKRKQK